MIPVIPKLSVDGVLERIEVRWRNPLGAGVAVAAQWVVDGLNNLERIADALERLADAQQAAQAPPMRAAR